MRPQALYPHHHHHLVQHRCATSHALCKGRFALQCTQTHSWAGEIWKKTFKRFCCAKRAYGGIFEKQYWAKPTKLINCVDMARKQKFNKRKEKNHWKITLLMSLKVYSIIITLNRQRNRAAECCRVLQSAAECCIVLQCVAVFCSVLHHIASPMRSCCRVL